MGLEKGVGTGVGGKGLLFWLGIAERPTSMICLGFRMGGKSEKR